MSTSAYRLSRDVTPVRYEIELDASPRRKRFSARLDLRVEVHSRTQSVELHARDLTLTSCFAAVRRQRVEAEAAVNVERQTVVLTFARALPKGRCTLHLTFHGRLNTNMHGLYLAQDGRERALVSQCEASDARAIFPCFDEPSFKAVFAWRVLADEGWMVICNGLPERVTKRRGGGGRVMHVFKDTRRMSTYLAAVTIGRYAVLARQRVAGIPCQLLAAPGKEAQAKFAQEVTAFVIPWYEAYFARRFPFRKLDQVAVPGFDAGAMENTGAIFYRQGLLLMEPETAAWSGQKRIAEVIAHEIAHQWFGNLVTMQWWDDLWLNEAFATWIAFKCVDAHHPGWRMWDDYLEYKEHALQADALVSTHPVYTDVATPAEATELFDLITYEKGCAVLRMAERYVGEAAFRAGIRSYIERYAGANAAGGDLWACLEAASGEPITELMDGWIRRPGFPLVDVRLERHAEGARLHLRQRRFFAQADTVTSDDERDTPWPIPMIFVCGTPSGRVEQRVLMRAEGQTFDLDAPDVTWVYPNANAAGFFRVGLDAEASAALLHGGLTSLSPAERKALLEDCWALVLCGERSIDVFMELVEALCHDDDFLVTRAVSSRLSELTEQVAAERDLVALRAWIRRLVTDQFDAATWRRPGATPRQAVHRAAVLVALGDLGRDPVALSFAGELVTEEIEDPTQVQPELAEIAVALHALDGGRARLERYLGIIDGRSRSGAPPQLKGRYVTALSCFEEPSVIAAVHTACLDGTVPQEDLRSVLAAMLRRRATQGPTWSLLKEHWQAIAGRVGAMGIARLVESTGALPVEARADVVSFFAAHPVPEAERALRKAIEAMEVRAALRRREGERLSSWLAQQAPPG